MCGLCVGDSPRLFNLIEPLCMCFPVITVISQSRTFTPGEPIEGVVPLGASYTPAQRALMEAAIMNATTPEEVDRLEYYYKQGIVPPELQGSMGGSGGASVTVIAGGGSGEGQTQPTVTVTGGDVD